MFTVQPVQSGKSHKDDPSAAAQNVCTCCKDHGVSAWNGDAGTEVSEREKQQRWFRSLHAEYMLKAYFKSISLNIVYY